MATILPGILYRRTLNGEFCDWKIMSGKVVSLSEGCVWGITCLEKLIYSDVEKKEGRKAALGFQKGEEK